MADTAEVLIRRWFEELWNHKREETIDGLLAPDAIVHGLPTPDGAPMKGSAGFRQLYRDFRAAFPDLTVRVTNTVLQGDQCAAFCDVRGTHTGDGLGLKATHRPVHFIGIVIVRARDGKLVEGWNSFDFLSMYQQIGAVPATGGTISA